MQRLTISVVCLFLMIACGDHEVSVPTAPTANPSPVTPLPPPTRIPVPAFTQRIDIGEVVRSRATDEDPLCDTGWPYRCRYYGLTVPSAGWLNVTIGWDPELPGEYPLDMGIIDGQGREWVSTPSGAALRHVAVPVTAGTTYVIEVWSFWSPPADFQLTPSLQTQ
jgi:hypothetical protein